MSGLRDWLRRKLGLHVHEWGPIETFVVAGQEYSDGPIHIKVLKRTVHYQCCDTCGECNLVYPGTALRVPFGRMR